MAKVVAAVQRGGFHQPRKEWWIQKRAHDDEIVRALKALAESAPIVLSRCSRCTMRNSGDHAAGENIVNTRHTHEQIAAVKSFCGKADYAAKAVSTTLIQVPSTVYTMVFP